MTSIYMLTFILAGLCLSTGSAKNALLIIDVQNCFMPTGPLPVPDAEAVAEAINELRVRHSFDLVALSQDSHCSNHVSFASQHEGYEPFEVIGLDYNKDAMLCRSEAVDHEDAVNCSEIAHHVEQKLWPDHCVTGTEGEHFYHKLNIKETDRVVRKGYRCHVDSYSMFYDNGGFTKTEMDDILKEENIDTVYFAGLAMDFCVSWSALDAKKLGYKSHVIVDATKIFTKEGADNAIEDLKKNGVILVHSSDLQPILRKDEL